MGRVGDQVWGREPRVSPCAQDTADKRSKPKSVAKNTWTFADVAFVAYSAELGKYCKMEPKGKTTCSKRLSFQGREDAPCWAEPGS